MAKRELGKAARRGDFVQLYRPAMQALRELAVEAPMAHAMLYLLMEQINERNALVASYATLSRLTGKSRATVTRALSELRRRNYIETVRAGNISVIVVNKRVVWTTDTGLRDQLAVFDARVIASASEQPNPKRLGREPDLVKLPPLLQTGGK